MRGSTLPHILRRAGRSLWENLYLNAVSTGVIAATLLLLGVYLTVQHNLNSIVDTWSRDVHISAYFHPDLSEDSRFEARDQLALRAGVERVRYVSEADAEVWLLERVEGLGPILSELGDGILPASLEITLSPALAQPDTIAAFAQEMAGPEFTDIDYGREWIERFNAFLSLLQLLGALLGSIILIAAMFLVTNTVYLVVYSRRDELVITRLVGGSGAFITTPFLIEGLLQGLSGALLALGGLWVVHRVLVVRLQAALKLDMAGDLQFLPLGQIGALLLIAIALGIGASLIAVRRFLLQAP